MTGRQETPCIELVLCHYMHAHTHTHRCQTHPCWNKHNTPAPLSWVTLPKWNNNDRLQGGDVCLCVCPLMKHTQTRKSYRILSLEISDFFLGKGWRSKLPRGQQHYLWGEGKLAQLGCSIYFELRNIWSLMCSFVTVFFLAKIKNIHCTTLLYRWQVKCITFCCVLFF